MTPASDRPRAPDGEIVRLGVSVCVFRSDRVLMIERGKPPGVGLWAPVGGGIEAGETAEAAALREVGEETAVAIALIGRVGTREIVVPAGDGGATTRIVLEVFAARWISGEPVAGDDAADARFVTLAEVEALPLMPGVLPWIVAARRLFDAGGDGAQA